MRYVEAPESHDMIEGDIAVFLAGGIQNCPDWQAEMVEALGESDLTLMNPRRANFPMGDPTAAEAQITWEHKHLRRADAISFWFCKDTMQPIVLYELGAWSMGTKQIFVGIDPEYPRRQDVEIQTKLARPDVCIVYSLDELIEQIHDWAIKQDWLDV
jgi:hypothetical protein